MPQPDCKGKGGILYSEEFWVFRKLEKKDPLRSEGQKPGAWMGVPYGHLPKPDGSR